MTISTPQVSRYTGGSNRELHALWESGVATLHPAYSLPLAKFSTLLAYPTAVIFVARKDDAIVGFALTYTIRSGASTNPAAAHLKGTLSALAVSPSARGVGVGTALHGAAMAYLTTTVRESLARSTPPAAESVIQLGSVFPRIFPGLPALDAFKGSKEWFAARGWTFDADVAIDLYGRIPAPVDQSAFLAKPHGHGLTFRPARPGDEEGIMLLQKEFDSFTVSARTRAVLITGMAGHVPQVLRRKQTRRCPPCRRAQRGDCRRDACGPRAVAYA
jgi:GNAT superfamily N-acetyltransferase